MVVQVTDSTRTRATRSLFSVSSCSDNGAGTASPAVGIPAASSIRLSTLNGQVIRLPWQLAGTSSIAWVAGAARDLDRLAGVGRQIGDDGFVHEFAASVPPGGVVGVAVAYEVGKHHLARVVIDGPRPEYPLRDGVEGDGHVISLGHVALDDFHHLGFRFVARQGFAGALIFRDTGARRRQYTDERHEVAL